jgi:hypothetical protein
MNVKNRGIFIFLLFLLLNVALVGAQVTIGSIEDPHPGAVLDLQSDSLGLLLSKVSIKNDAEFQLVKETGDEETDEAIRQSAIGMIVFNTNDQLTEGTGLYIWTGAKWKRLLTDEVKTDIADINKEVSDISKNVSDIDSRTNYSNKSSFQLPLPRGLVRVDILNVDYNSLAKDDPKPAVMRYDDGDGHYFEKNILLEFQGASSIAYDKKNFAFDILNSNGKSCDVKFGDWAVMDSYHLKANYVDFTQARNITIARLAYQAANTRNFGKRYPWEIPYSATNTTLNQRFDSGARGRVDGFPISLYINGTYWGNYTFNIKKTRKNFDMKKGDKTKVLMFSETHSNFSQYHASQWDIKNPDPVTPETQDAINRVFNWMGSINSNDANFLSQYTDYWNKDEFIDYFVFLTVFHLTDNVRKNTGFMTSDGEHWSPMLYDLDTSFGLWWTGSYWTPDSETTLYPDAGIANSMPWKPVVKYWLPDVKTRYNELRKTVLSVKNVETVLKSITDVFGVDEYDKDAKLWKKIPSNGNPDINGNFPGVYTGISQLMDWYIKRTDYLDSQWQ